MADLHVVVGRGGYAASQIMGQASPPPSGIVYDTPNLWVDPNGSDHSDSYTRAQIIAGAGSKQWTTLGRAVWGHASRGSANPSEAAQAGDVVEVANATYTAPGEDNRQVPAFNAVNDGTASNRIVFQASDGATLQLSSLAGPVIGSYVHDYVTWRGFTVDEANAPYVSDTGPAVVWDATGIYFEDCVLITEESTDGDNHSCIRLDNAYDSQVRYCELYQRNGLHETDENHSGITWYTAVNCLIEHNYIHDTGAGIYMKGDYRDGPRGPEDNIIRYNKFANSGNGIRLNVGWFNHIYQNTFNNCLTGMTLNLDGGAKDQCRGNIIANNTMYDSDSNAIFFLSLSSTPGYVHEVKNNIFHTAGVVLIFSYNLEAWSNVEWEHNCYYGFTGSNLAALTDGNHDFATWQSHGHGDTTDPDGQVADPLFVNAAGGNFRLQGGSPCINAGIDILDLDGDSSTTDPITQGAYITGDEVIGRS